MKTDYEIRQETEKDYPQVFKLVEEAFRDMEESDHREQFLVERLRHSPAFVPELSLVADEDGGVVGYGLMTRVSIRSGILDAESLALAPVAVRPDRQSMGIGSALIRELQPFTEILETKAGCTVSSHCGPNCLGVLFLRKEG